MRSADRIMLLRTNANFRRLFAARSISYIGDAMAAVALLLHVQATEDSALAVSLLLLAQTLPYLLGPFAGTLADRIDQRMLMIVADLGQAALFALIALLLPSLPTLLVLVAGAFLLATLFRPAGRGAIPALVDRSHLMIANAWLGTAFNLSFAIGPLAGGLLTDAFGVRIALLIDALTFVVSAAYLARLPTLPSSAEDEERTGGFFQQTRSGLAFVTHHAASRPVVLALFLGVAFAAMDDVALVFLTREELGAGPVGFGIASSAYGIGMLVASGALTRWQVGISTAFLFVVGFALNGVGGFFTGLAPVLAGAVLMQAVSGFGNGATNVSTDTLIQETVPRHLLGRVFGLISTAAFLGGAIARIAGGFLLEATSARTVFVVGGVGTLAVTLIAGIALVRAARNDPDVSATAPRP